MRNPNGYGSVYKLSGNRRKPFAARITVGFNRNPEKGTAYPIYKFIGYYATRKEAMTALALYNNDPSSVVVVNNTLIPTNRITLQRVYDEWSEEHYKKVSKSAIAQYTAGFKAIKAISERPFESLTVRDYEDAFVNSGKSKILLSKTKIVLKQMYIYAFRREYIQESLIGIPQYISLDNCAEQKYHNEHNTFKKDEIASLWSHKDDEGVQIVLFMIYTGLRIEETSLLLKEDVHLQDRYFTVRKSKTEAGLRDVPISERIVFIVENWLQSDDEFLVPLGKTKSIRKQSRRNGWDKTMSAYGLEHLQHDTRYTCSTLLTEAGVDDRFVKLIVGHKSQDVTNKIYVKKVDIKVLIEAINKI